MFNFTIYERNIRIRLKEYRSIISTLSVYILNKANLKYNMY